MMRRAGVSTFTAVGARGITNYNFGHPDMGTSFLPANHYKAKNPASDAGVRVSKLPNGARVVTHDLQGAQVSIGAFIEAGAKFDPVGLPGLNYVLRWGLAGSNMENSLFQIDRNARSVGASTEHTEVRKRFIGLKFDVAAGGWERVAQDIFTSIAAPRFQEYDVDKFRDTMDSILNELRWQQPREYAIARLETVAFYREALGNPRYVLPEFNDKVSHSALLEQWTKLVVPSRVVLAGVNVDHDALIAAYENNAFSHSAQAPHHARAEAIATTIPERDQFYPGGEFLEFESRVKAMGTKCEGEEEAIFAVGFVAPGADDNVKQYAGALVARELASIAFGETTAINQHATRLGTESFYRPYATAGLFGATVRADPYAAKEAVAAAVNGLRNLPTDAESIKFAQARAVARFYSENLDSARDYVDFLGSSLIGDGINRVSVDALVSAIGSIDSAALKPVLEGLKQRPALFGTGDVYGVPSLRKLGF